MSEELTPRQETADWLRRPLTENETTVFKFLIPRERAHQRDRILVAHGSLECDVAFLDAPIPQEALDAFFGVSVDEEGNETPNVTGLTLKGFSLRVDLSLDGTKAIVLLGAMERPTTRKHYVNADDLMDWVGYVGAFGFTIDDILTKEESTALRQSEAYSLGAE